MRAIHVPYTKNTVAGLACYYNNGVVVRYSAAASLLRPPSSTLSGTPHASCWRENSGKTQKPSKKNTLATFYVPRALAEREWTSIDADVSSLPTYRPDVVPQPRPRSTRTTTNSSTRGVIGYPILVFYFFFFSFFFWV